MIEHVHYVREELNAKIEEVLLPILHDRMHNVCLIDPPAHTNVGDSAILIGELDYIEKNFPIARLSYYDVDSYSGAADKYIDRADIILLHGGGNFGDLWPHHHAIRTAIIKKFPHKRIIQFPQSIHFQNREPLEETARAIDAHPDFTLLVRDAKSFAFAEKHFTCSVTLIPDMAFAMKPIRRSAPPTVDYFCLLRSDKEAIADHAQILHALQSQKASVKHSDWSADARDLVVRLDRRLKKLVAVQPSMFASFGPQLMALRRKNAEIRMASGIGILSQGRFVVTDRLHAHIIASLLGIPNLAFDSLDGKISALFSTWSSAASPGAMCPSADELSICVEAMTI